MMAFLSFSLLALFILPVAANEMNAFADAAQKLIDKIESGDDSVPVLKNMSEKMKEHMLQPAEKVKPMTAANPIKPPVPPETQAEDMPKALAEFPKIDWDKPLNKSLLSDSVKKFLKKEDEASNKKVQAAMKTLRKVYQKKVGPGGVELMGRPWRLNDKDVPRLFSSPSLRVAPLCAFVVTFIGLALFALWSRREGLVHASLVSDCEDLSA